MTKPADRFYYGAIYHRIFDPALANARKRTVDFIPAGVSVLDIACGTGQLSLELRTQKQCRVVGVDRSEQMLHFAKSADRSSEVDFRLLDASDLSCFADGTFDFGTILFLLHELSVQQRLAVLSEASRVAHAVLLVDSHSPLPNNLTGLGIRFVEATFGRDHNQNFRDFLRRKGIPGLLAQARPSLTVLRSERFDQGTRELVVVSRQSG